ncbi:MAG: UvrD-helicase domain-containing protein [Oscillospiraceae bacterium]|nr:UvrD-helicase domain-containing protein [Oscillospiraceae bacterium]
MRAQGAAHPAWQAELAHLADTLAVVAEESARTEAETADQARRVETLRVEAGGIFSADEQVARQVLDILRHSAHTLALSAQRPYFTRVDFTPEGGAPQTHYIGKWGVVARPAWRSVVVDWRSPVANLYYAGQLGPVHYAAPDGEVRGELTLKRHLDVEEGALRSVFDTDLASRDAYLQQALAAVAPARLREIVSTIQAEQNLVIRHPPGQSLVVQGVAGSGKTTIALHRVAWLLYALQDRLAPEHLLILAPSPLFLDYISAVLPDLGVERARQRTLRGLLDEVLGKALPRPDPGESLQDVLAMPPADRSALALRLRYMGSLRFRDAMLAYIRGLEENLAPPGALTFGPVTLFTQADLHRLLTRDLAGFPLRRRLAELQKPLKRALAQALGQVEAWLRKECDRRADALAGAMPDGPERQARMARLYASRDARLAEARAEAKRFVPQAMARFAALDPFALYLAFLRTPADALPAADRAAWALVCRRADALARAKRLPPEDVPAFCLLLRAIAGWPRQDIRHAVIDEAQDWSPFEVWLVRELAGHAPFTVVGDLMQGIHGYRGLADWDELRGGALGGADLARLVTSYRNTVEIMAFAAAVAARHALPGQARPRPVLRHGPAPQIVACADATARDAAAAARIRAWQAEGFRSIALIGRDEAECRALCRGLPELAPRLVTQKDTAFSGGLVALPAALVKGLEFDAVLLADVSADRWADDALEARLLYVCLTRPLHRLACCHIGPPSALLPREGTVP